MQDRIAETEVEEIGIAGGQDNKEGPDFVGPTPVVLALTPGQEMISRAV